MSSPPQSPVNVFTRVYVRTDVKLEACAGEAAGHGRRCMHWNVRAPSRVFMVACLGLRLVGGFCAQCCHPFHERGCYKRVCETSRQAGANDCPSRDVKAAKAARGLPHFASVNYHLCRPEAGAGVDLPVR